jgi:hypothetical protein
VIFDHWPLQARHLPESYSDSGTNNGAITVYVATIPPSAQFTSAQESVRESVNAAICGSAQGTGTCSPGGTGAYYIGGANGYVDFAAAVSAGGTDLSSTVAAADLYNGSPDNSYYRAEANAYIAAAAAAAGGTGSLGIKPDRVRSVTR